MIPLPADVGVEILRTEVGSTLHGTGLGVALEDHDEMGIFVEHPATTIGIDHVILPPLRAQPTERPLVPEHWSYRTQPEGHRSGPGDTDLICYSLRKWAALALKGNPSVLLPLFAPADKVVVSSPLGDDLRANTAWFASRTAGKAFLGYMGRQRARMTGERGPAGRIRIQPDGQVDWKYAMHMLRLGYQGIEFLTSGRLTLPIPGRTGDFLRAVRQGHYPLDQVFNIADNYEQTLIGLVKESGLPEHGEREKVQEFVIRSHLETWR